MFSITIQVFLTGGKEPVSVRYFLDADPARPQLWRALHGDLHIAVGTYSGNWDPREVLRASVEDFLVCFPELFRESHGILIQTAPMTPVVA